MSLGFLLMCCHCFCQCVPMIIYCVLLLTTKSSSTKSMKLLIPAVQWRVDLIFQLVPCLPYVWPCSWAIHCHSWTPGTRDQHKWDSTKSKVKSRDDNWLVALLNPFVIVVQRFATLLISLSLTFLSRAACSRLSWKCQWVMLCHKLTIETHWAVRATWIKAKLGLHWWDGVHVLPEWCVAESIAECLVIVVSKIGLSIMWIKHARPEWASHPLLYLRLLFLGTVFIFYFADDRKGTWAMLQVPEENMMIHSHTVHTQVNDVLADPAAHAWEVIQKTVHLWLEIKWCKNSLWRWSVFRWADKLLRKLSKILSPNLHRPKQRRWKNPTRRFALSSLYALQAKELLLGVYMFVLSDPQTTLKDWHSVKRFESTL